MALLGFLSQPGISPAMVASEVLGRLNISNPESNPEIVAAVQKALEQVKGTARFVELVRDFKLKDQDQELVTLAEQQPNGAGVEAVRLLLHQGKQKLIRQQFSTETASLGETATPPAASNLVALVQALGNTDEKAIVPLLEPLVTNSAPAAAVVRRQAVRSLANVQTGAAELLRLARDGALAEDLKLLAGSELASARWPKIKAEAAQLLPPPNSVDSTPLPSIAELLKMKGDPANGAAVYRRENVGCLKCHQVKGEGTDFGPNLSEIGTKLGKDALYESILEPSAGISFGYEGWQLQLKNGDDASGLIVSETADELALKAVGGIVTRYKKSDIASRTQQKLSLMPADLQRTMTAQELVDLVEYLSTLKH